MTSIESLAQQRMEAHTARRDGKWLARPKAERAPGYRADKIVPKGRRGTK